MIKQLPSLSIIVPSYNQATYLEETLLSIIEQQYPGLELIVIDGGSTDGSVEIIRRYAKHISYWVSEPDRGQSHAVNKGLQQANGEWVAWINSDDCYLPQRLTPFFAGIRHPAYDFIHGYCTTGSTMDSPRFRKFKRNYKTKPFHVLLFFLATEYIIPSQSIFVRREILQHTGNLREDLHYVMDMDWFFRIYLHTNAARRCFYDVPLCFYRKHPSTKTATEGGRKMYAEACQVAKDALPYLSQHEQWIINTLLNTDTSFRRQFQQLSAFTQWLSLALRYPLHLWFNPAFKARGKQLWKAS